ncbi:small peptidoglycan-associated lipoprotein [Mesobacillus subterraneus]|uniref:small peptidoglycan-associated lipoprotein n=1 Tax=Mesobacillus subterraneus TaxID=285983 RepID=UPI001CFD5F2E|nr:small peptidoglycan-associated lipoprotein [Mesobacillus subterraneus]WLR53646.1 small peptidoglycan-associated lipoprotein [Mesobacillus subterraneus]
MKSLSFVFVASFLFLTASCNPVNDSDQLELNKNIKQVIFFSDDENYKKEASYYDAIIELKKEYPAEFDKIVVISAANANKYYDLFKVKKFPAILIIHQEQVLANVNGDVTKDQIIEPLSAVLNNES